MGNAPMEHFVLDTTSRDIGAYYLGVKLTGRASLLDEKFKAGDIRAHRSRMQRILLQNHTMQAFIVRTFSLALPWASKIECSLTPRYERRSRDARHRFCRPVATQSAGIIVGGVISLSAPIVDSPPHSP